MELYKNVFCACAQIMRRTRRRIRYKLLSLSPSDNFPLVKEQENPLPDGWSLTYRESRGKNCPSSTIHGLRTSFARIAASFVGAVHPLRLHICCCDKLMARSSLSNSIFFRIHFVTRRFVWRQSIYYTDHHQPGGEVIHRLSLLYWKNAIGVNVLFLLLFTIE